MIFRYEKSSEYEKDKRIRNITTTARNGKEHTVNKENHKNMSVQNKSRNALININGSDSSAKPPQSPKTKIKSKEAPKPVGTKESVNSATKITKPSKAVIEEVKIEPQPPSRTSWRDRVAEKNKEETKKTEKVIEKVCEKNKEETIKSEKVITQPKSTKPVPAKEEAPANNPPTARKSWRDKVAEKEKEEEDMKQNNVIKKQEPKEVLTEEEEEEKRHAQEMARSIRQKIEAQFPLEELTTEKTKAPASTSDGDKKPESNANDNKTEEGSQGEKVAAGQEEEEDTHGTKKMKSDFDAKMIALEEEMAAGRGKLAKLRERIRKAKGTVKAADNALDDAKKS